MAKLVVKIEHQKDMCYNEIGLCVKNLDIILGSIANKNKRDYMIT